MKFNKLTKNIVIFCVAFSVMLSATFIKSDEVLGAPYTDVEDDAWYAEAISELYDAEIIPGGGTEFHPNINAQRQDIVLYIYNLAHIGKDDLSDELSDMPFSDVSTDNNAYYEPLCWAYEKGIITGYTDNTMKPFNPCTKEELCVMLMRYLACEGISPREVGTSVPFADSMGVSSFARSAVVAAKLSGFVNGNEKSKFLPWSYISRAEVAQVVYKVFKSQTNPAKEGDKTVDVTMGAYDGLYDSYPKQILDMYHTAYTNETPMVDLSYFDDVVLVGDSVSMSLQMYCASTKALGNAAFLCAGSLSPLNAHWPLTHPESKHPVYMGQKLTVEDAVAKIGRKKVYILLGINSLSFGVDRCVNETKLLVEKILQKTPDAKIVMQSVTPMTSDSPIKSSKLNNAVISEFNTKLLDLCQNNGWYYVNISEAVCDESGNLNKAYCSDPASMGIHFNYTADKVWIDYLRTHIPNF